MDSRSACARAQPRGKAAVAMVWQHPLRRLANLLRRPAPAAPEVPPEPATATESLTPVATALAISGKRVMLFIDEPNVARSLSDVRAQGKDLDYQKLNTYFSGEAPLAGAFFYTGYVNSQVGMQAFFRKLGRLGYEVVQVRSKRYRDGTVKNADPDIKIVTDLFLKMNEYDEAILISGDGDFADAVQQLLKKGKRVKVVSMRNRLAQELRESGAEIIFLEDILGQLLMERTMRSGPTSPAGPRSLRHS